MSVVTLNVEIEALKKDILHVITCILGFQDKDIEAVEVFKETHPDEERLYDVFKVTTHDQDFVVKKSNHNEIEIYEKYLLKSGFSVPDYYGHMVYKDQIWMVQAFVSGTDLKHFDKKHSQLCAGHLAEISNSYWKDASEFVEKGSRMDQYLVRLEKRRKALVDHPVLLKAYDVFLKTQVELPVTLIHADLLPTNVLCEGDDLTFIDWGFSGFLPYSLDPARLVAHGSADDPVYKIEDDTRKTFLRTYYEGLKAINFPYEEFLWHIKLATLNEYIEFIERNLQSNNFDPACSFSTRYYQQAMTLAHEINGHD